MEPQGQVIGIWLHSPAIMDSVKQVDSCENLSGMGGLLVSIFVFPAVVISYC